MNIFQMVKSAVSVKDAATYYGLHVQRHGMMCCLFHDDRNPSMKLNEDYFYCFGCGVSGDVIDLTAKVFGLSAYEAARKLASDFGLNLDKPPTTAMLQKPRYSVTRSFRQEAMHCHRVVCDYLHLLENWRTQYAPETPETALDDRFVEACQMFTYIEYLADVLTFGDQEQRAKAVERLQKEGLIVRLEERMNRLRREEETQHEKEQGCA